MIYFNMKGFHRLSVMLSHLYGFRLLYLLTYQLVSLVILALLMTTAGCGGGGSGSSGGGGGNYSATLTWSAPTTNTDGTPLTDLVGYKIYYGTSSGSYSVSVDVGNVTTYTVDSLSSGTYYFVVTAYDGYENESNYSNEVTKTM